MKYFSTFSGVGGFELGIEYAMETNKKETKCTGEEDEKKIRGWRNESSHEGNKGLEHCDESRLCEQPNERGSGQPICIGFSEIDKYASAVLKYRFPNTKNYGNIKEINWADVPDFDLLVGGSPCQDFSIAGKRAGLDGERSGLFSSYLLCLQRKKPKYFIWENVKGVMSSRGGWDFANIQIALSEAGYSLWWQVLNAKDFGVPQNRERIFVVGTRNGGGREVFFEREADNQDIVQINKPRHSNDQVYSDEGISPTLNTMQGGNRQPFVACKNSSRMVSCTHGKESKLDDRTLESQTKLRTEDECLLCLQDRKEDRDTSQERGLARQSKGESGGGLSELPHEGTQQTTKVQSPDLREATQAKRVLRQTQSEVQEVGEPSQDKTQSILRGSRIRRLTPLEAERLMSWPDVLEIETPTYDYFRRALQSEMEKKGTTPEASRILRDLRANRESCQTPSRHIERPRENTGGVWLMSSKNTQGSTEGGMCNLWFGLSTEASKEIKALWETRMSSGIESPFGEQTLARISGWTQYGDFDGEVKEISDTQRYKMCGNGVVSEVVKHLMKEVIGE